MKAAEARRVRKKLRVDWNCILNDLGIGIAVNLSDIWLNGFGEDNLKGSGRMMMGMGRLIL